jgi:histidine triad (HIT) family protein
MPATAAFIFRLRSLPMGYLYDDQNIFAKILRGEIPNTTVLETEHCLAFRDISAQAPEHVLVIPKGPYVCFDHFANTASAEEIIDFTRAIGQVTSALKVDPGTGGDGYRLLANTGKDGVQDVPHLHVHLVAGRPLGRMLRDG